MINLHHAGTHLTNTFTLATTSGQTIGDVASGSYVLYTKGETLWLISDGANWQILKHNTKTGRVSFAPTVKGSGGDPTIATSGVITAFWERDGSDMIYNFSYIQTATAGSANGTGTYMFPLPSGATIDNTKQVVSSADNNVGNCGNASTFGTVGGHGIAKAYDTGHIAIRMMNTGANLAYVGSGTNQYSAGANVVHTFICRVPVSGWQP
jgi:hypothetical protein